MTLQTGWRHGSGHLRRHSIGHSMARRGMPSAAASTHGAVHAAAVAGLVARGVVYGVMGWLAVDVAVGHYGGEVNQKGALAQVAARNDGKVLLAVLALGLAGYALWRLSQAVWGNPTPGAGAGSRLKSLCRGLVYGFLCYTALAVLVGSAGTGQAQEQQGATARLMHHTAGRWLIGIIGLIVVIIGVVMLVEGILRRFLKELDTARMSHGSRRLVTYLGVFGGVARGVVVGVAGGLIIDAAVTADPAKSSGLDGALRSLAKNAVGPWLLGIAAFGLIAFGIFSVVSARWVRI